MSEVRRENGVRNRFPLSGKRFLTPFLLALALAAGAGVWWWTRTPPPEPPMPDLTEVDPEVVEAITAAREAVRQRPTDGHAWGRYGMALRAHDFGNDANHCFREAERLDPREPRWPYLQGLTLVLTDPEAGIPCLRRAVERCEDELLAVRLRLAETLLAQGRLDEAVTHLEHARQLEPDNPRVHLGLGRLALAREQWRTALEHLGACVDDEHARKLAYTLRAECWTRLREGEKARDEQRQAEQASEDQAWPDPFVREVLRMQCGLQVRLQQAGELFQHQQPMQAVRLLEETVKHYPRSTAAWMQLGNIWHQLEQPDRAESAFREAARIDPDSPDAWFRLGCIQALDRPGEAAESFRRTIRLKPDHALAHFNLAHRLKQLGDADGAADEFRAALRCRPDYAPARDALRELENQK